MNFMGSAFLRSVMFVICLCLQFQTDAQHKLRVHYKIEDGLLSNTIYTILQDQKGFIWISTDNGVCRFDGQHFKRYSTANGLPDNDILSMEIDASDRIWLSTFNKNLCYIWNGEVHTRLNDSSLARFWQQSYVKFLAKLQSGIVIIDDAAGIAYELLNSGKIRKNEVLRDIVNIGNYYVRVRDKQLECYTHEHRFLTSGQLPSTINGAAGIFQNGVDSFVIISPSATYQGIVANSRLIFTLAAEHLSQGVRFFTRNNQLWGIDQKNILRHYHSDSALAQQSCDLDQLTVTHFFVDQKGGYWIGTKGDGIYYYPNMEMVYYNTVDGLLNDNAFFSYENRGELYILLAGGKIQMISNQVVDKKILDVSTLCAGKVNRLFVNDQYIVAASDIGCLYYYNRINHQKNCYQKFASIKDIEFDYDNHVLMATSSHIVSYDLATHQSVAVLKERHTCVKRFDQNIVLAGGVNFLKLVYYPVQSTNTDSIYVIREFKLNNATIADIQIGHSMIAIATVESGVYLYMQQRLHHLSVANGLTDNNCKSIYFDEAHNIWISTAMGLNKVTPGKNGQDYVIEKFTTFSGLSTNNVNCVNQVGKYMYAAGSKGIMQFPENYIQVNNDSPRVYITEINVNGRVLQNNINRVVVPPDSNNLKIDFTGIEYKSFGHIRYFYRIHNLEEEWKEATSSTIPLERLKPNTYQLEIRALSAYNRWSSKPAILKIIILPYWWQQNIFKWLMVICGVFLISFITRYFLNRKYKKKLMDETLKQQLVEVELKALKAQINPHFIFNTLNAIQYFIQNEENERADNYLNKMSKLIRSTLNFSNEASIPLSDELDYIDNYLALESLRFDDDFSYSIEKNIPDRLLSTPIPTMVLQPHIENAIRHGLKPKKTGRKELLLRLTSDDQYLICNIEDNGIGRKKSMEINQQNTTVHTSQGFSLSKAKLEIFQKMFKKDVQFSMTDLYTNAYATGTRITIKIQL